VASTATIHWNEAGQRVVSRRCGVAALRRCGVGRRTHCDAHCFGGHETIKAERRAIGQGANHLIEQIGGTGPVAITNA